MLDWPTLSPFNQQLLLLVSVLLLKVLLQKIAPHHPWLGFRFYCSKLAEKVNKAENSDTQKRIAGIVAVVITFLPLWIIAWLFESLVAIPTLWQGLLLYFALGSGNIFSLAKAIAMAITANNNYQAKQLLKPFVLRDTDKLSKLGLTKATIEMQILTHLHHYVSVCFFFLLLGPLAAFSYRLILEMHYSWNTKRHPFKYFGRFAYHLVQVLQWVPSRLFVLVALLLTVGQNFLLVWRLSMMHFFSTTNDCVLAFFAPAHNIRLGGVAMYDMNKLRKASFNDHGHQPEPKDIISIQRFIWRIYLLSAVILLGFSVISQLL